MFELSTLHDLTGGRRGIFDVPCPGCAPECKTEAGRRRKVLRVWDDGEFATFKCARCERKGWAKGKTTGGVRPQRAEPVQSEDKSELASFLWGKAKPALGTLVQRYMESRSCWVDSPALRFLPGRGDHPPAMIARYGTGSVRAVKGVHLTKLSADGGKAGTEKDKIMIGPSMGTPIVISNNAEREEIIIAEGNEDTASIVRVTSWSGFSAGSAGRIPSVVAAAANFPKVYVAVDDDRAGRMALERSLLVRPDLIPLPFGKMMSERGEKMDANRVLIKYGDLVLLSLIDMCEAQAMCSRGQIGYHAMQRSAEVVNTALKPFTEHFL